MRAGERPKKRVWRKGSVAVFQTVGAGSNPATRSGLLDRFMGRGWAKPTNQLRRIGRCRFAARSC
jgi:hypothetical protein